MDWGSTLGDFRVKPLRRANLVLECTGPGRKLRRDALNLRLHHFILNHALEVLSGGYDVFRMTGWLLIKYNIPLIVKHLLNICLYSPCRASSDVVCRTLPCDMVDSTILEHLPIVRSICRDVNRWSVQSSSTGFPDSSWLHTGRGHGVSIELGRSRPTIGPFRPTDHSTGPRAISITCLIL